MSEIGSLEHLLNAARTAAADVPQGESVVKLGESLSAYDADHPQRSASKALDDLEELLDAPPVDSAAYVLLLEEYVTARIRESGCVDKVPG